MNARRHMLAICTAALLGIGAACGGSGGEETTGGDAPTTGAAGTETPATAGTMEGAVLPDSMGAGAPGGAVTSGDVGAGATTGTTGTGTTGGIPQQP